MVHDELRGGVEVRPVELVGDVPAQRTKFTTFLFHDLVNFFSNINNVKYSETVQTYTTS